MWVVVNVYVFMFSISYGMLKGGMACASHVHTNEITDMIKCIQTYAFVFYTVIVKLGLAYAYKHTSCDNHRWIWSFSVLMMQRTTNLYFHWPGQRLYMLLLSFHLWNSHNKIFQLRDANANVRNLDPLSLKLEKGIAFQKL